MPSTEPLKRKVVMIDNYDSFTWNLYQYLCLEGADVEVYRNDKITIKEIESIKPDLIVISPGPGHPKTDAGISREVIDYFKGKLPVLGVCMGQQCIYEVFGGEVEYAGEIVHGKTSTVTHDNKGIFKNVPQGVAITRYHSLAGSITSLPDSLEVTCTTDNGIIMGVRHKEYVIEGVQFHPESILTEEGHLMIRNMLSLKGGYWKDNETSATTTTATATVTSNGNTSILDKIYYQRKLDYESIVQLPGQSFSDLEEYLSLGLAPKLINFYDRLNENISIGKPAILSEIKRASPSKGAIDMKANAAKQALTYANAGVSTISVLTEPHWFKGSIDDLKLARKAIDSVINRPCILRKEFIFNKYQILEARLSGADTVLLIVKMLDYDLLFELFQYSKSLGMEPLVEINNADELKLALKVGASVIGVNNRNLHNFDVDLENTNSLNDLIVNDTKAKGEDGKKIIILALSGISSVQDVQNYKKSGVYGYLIGEALMRKGDKVGEFIQELLNA
ncbi:hypothetical protein CANARDRAFT_198122 [[Candida] arabinofermentans NRRL YB-2248]|uniref:Multifunctional tryptophan biosynthesis protein n=1 Tax=[Candida] arabinofermentans NRRL YB-2248 TaxID=983967 RepID=A0A1E4T2S5_9ASCO|nr:hypothetical protein CANARDRAFT_198122 [[Candida] arabinofermentans NRRL YB-2248]